MKIHRSDARDLAATTQPPPWNQGDVSSRERRRTHCDARPTLAPLEDVKLLADGACFQEESVTSTRALPVAPSLFLSFKSQVVP